MKRGFVGGLGIAIAISLPAVYGIIQNADGFAAELKRLKIDFYEMKPGEIISFRGKQLVKGK